MNRRPKEILDESIAFVGLPIPVRRKRKVYQTIMFYDALCVVEAGAVERAETILQNNGVRFVKVPKLRFSYTVPSKAEEIPKPPWAS